MEMQLPNFVYIKHISKDRSGEGWMSVEARINPLHITSYMKTFIPSYNDKEISEVVAIFCAGQTYIVDMTIDEADEMISSIQRNMTLKEDE